MLEVWVPLLLCLALGAVWFHVLRLRESVIAHARRICDRHGLQLLDDSVALHRLHAGWRHGALHVVREYRFETSIGGDDRRSASLTLVGGNVVGARVSGREDPRQDAPAPTFPALHDMPAAQANAAADSNVVPIARARRTLH